MIFSEQWHDGLPCLVKEGESGGKIIVEFFHLTLLVFFVILLPFVTTKTSFVGSIDIADPHATTPSLRLVNKESLDRILQAEVYVNESDGQLRAAHLILGYTPISHAFQAPRCVIRARDPRLHRISVAYEGFVVPQGIPLPKYSPLMKPLLVATLTAGATSSPPPLVLQMEEEKESEQEEEGFVDLIVSTNDYEVFNQPSPSQNEPEDMGIQRKPQRSLQELLESQPGRGEAGKPSQSQLPPPSPKSPPRAP